MNAVNPVSAIHTIMAELAYLKGVRTKFRNTLESEIRMAKDLLTSDCDERNLSEIKVNITNCLEN